MERIRLMKERALADAARSQDNVLMTQGQQQPAAASAPVLVPRVRLDSRGGGGGEGSREGSSPVEEFSLLEAVEEATINKSAAQMIKPGSPRLSHTRSLLEVVSPRSRRGGDSPPAMVALPATGVLSPAHVRVSPRRRDDSPSAKEQAAPAPNGNGRDTTIGTKNEATHGRRPKE
ncbi:uncharacterized protein ACA1_042830 [Acanthamoeba castellanii str. Neff]|uniref:Uncharacterized protein n=1 Tax=Acanthamoeba castellanii (strain ATCC 30010 / Neff) TaxID=1257118 RepID=L8GVB9_ACACF|nr:uncharacterized protein ACA1_042830 [Acanthamoeba castellanii str. Neff]ELR16892.1 hypothetical protein ACA1_042830 [Acanthamoeba castellanii str. Neff]